MPSGKPQQSNREFSFKEVRMDTRMSLEEREAFLAETRVGIISIPVEGRGPLTMPVWYSYQPGGDICVCISSSSQKASLLQKAQRISFCVQDSQPPYKYISIEGPFTIQPINLERDLHPMALRYYGPELGEQYFVEINQSDVYKKSILVSIKPERWLTRDYSKEG
jgi:hypothetical protein